MTRPDESITHINVEEIRAVRNHKKFVPGYENADGVTHLTRSLLGMTALCGHYPVYTIGESNSGEFCPECVTEAKGHVK